MTEIKKAPILTDEEIREAIKHFYYDKKAPPRKYKGGVTTFAFQISDAVAQKMLDNCHLYYSALIEQKEQQITELQGACCAWEQRVEQAKKDGYKLGVDHQNDLLKLDVDSIRQETAETIFKEIGETHKPDIRIGDGGKRYWLHEEEVKALKSKYGIK